MANIAGSVFQGQIGSAHKELGSNAMVMEIVQRVTSTNTITLYGAENASAGSDDLKVIGHIVAVFAMPHSDDNDATYAALSSTTTKNDTATITCGQATIVYSLLVFGYPGIA